MDWPTQQWASWQQYSNNFLGIANLQTIQVSSDTAANVKGLARRLFPSPYQTKYPISRVLISCAYNTGVRAIVELGIVDSNSNWVSSLLDGIFIGVSSMNGIYYDIPLFIPAGVIPGIRIAASDSPSKTYQFIVSCVPADWNNDTSYSNVELIGINVATCDATSVARTSPSALTSLDDVIPTNVGSPLVYPARELTMFTGFGTAAVSNTTGIVQIGFSVGGVSSVIHTAMCYIPAGKSITGLNGIRLPATIPAGAQMWVKLVSFNAHEQKFGFMAYS